MKVISETFGLMDLEIQKKKGKFNEHDPNHALNLLIRDPSPYFNRYQWMQAVITHILLWGNGYNKIVRGRYGDPIESEPSSVTLMLDVVLASAKTADRGVDGLSNEARNSGKK